MTRKRALTTGALILVLMSLAWVMLGWNVLDSEKGSAAARVQAQYRLRRAVGGLVMGGIRQSGNPDLLEGGWVVLEARAEGYLGRVTRREKVSGSGHVLHVTPPKRISTLEDRSVPVSFEIRASRFVDIVAMGSVGRPLVDPVNFVSIFQSGSSQKASVLPVEGRASLSLDIGAREIPMAVFAYCKPSMWKSGEIYAGGTVSGFLVKKQITAGSLALSLGEGDGATGVFRADRGQSLSNHAFKVWLLLDGVNRPVSIYTCVADAQGRFAVGGIPRGIRFAVAHPDQEFQGKKTDLVIDPH